MKINFEGNINKCITVVNRIVEVNRDRAIKNLHEKYGEDRDDDFYLELNNLSLKWENVYGHSIVWNAIGRMINYLSGNEEISINLRSPIFDIQKDTDIEFVGFVPGKQGGIVAVWRDDYNDHLPGFSTHT